MYKQHELESGLQKLVDHGAVLMEDDWTVSRAVSDWYGMGGDDVSDKQSGDGFVSVSEWFTWLWDNEYISLVVGWAKEDLEAVVVKFKELQPEATATEQVEA